MLKSSVTGSADILSYASSFSSGQRGVILVDKGANPLTVNGSGPSELSGGPTSYASLKPYSSVTKNGLTVALPARSVEYMVVDKNKI